MSYGQKSYVGITFQNSFDSVGDVGSAHFIPFLSSNVGLEKDQIYEENAKGIFDEGDSYEGQNRSSGDIEIQAKSIPLGALFNCILEPISTVTSDAIYTHKFRPRSSDWDETCANRPVTVYTDLSDSGSAHQHYNLTGSMLELGIANGELLKAKVSFVGGGYSQVAAVSPTLPTGKIWTWETTSVSFGGSAFNQIQNLTVTVDDGGLEPKYTLNNSKFPSRIKRTGFRNVTIDGTFTFDNQDEYQEFISQSERELIINFKGATEIQSGYYDTLTVKLPAMRYEAFKPAPEGPGEIEVSVTARGKYHTNSSTALEITLTNTQASY